MVGRAPSALLAWLLVLAALAAACGGTDSDGDAGITPIAPTDGTLHVVADEWSFDPNGLLLTAREQVTIELQNDGRILHNIQFEDMPADVISSDSSGPLSADEGEAFVGADGGAGGTLELVPLEPGEYGFYCTIEGHRALGMEGVVIVQEAVP
jgi:plastocyanin